MNFTKVFAGLLWCLVIILPTSAFPSIPARFGLAPDNNQELLLSAVKSAKRHIVINIYEFKSQRIAEALISRIRSGVTLEILFEGEPMGGIASEEYKIIKGIQAAMARAKNGGNRLYIMTDGSGSANKRRFVYNHAKYMVVDETTTLIGSENFSPSGHTEPGMIGNRGWEILLEDAGFAKEMLDLFAEDTDLTHGDVLLIGPKDPLPVKTPVSLGNTPERPPSSPKPRDVPAIPIGSGKVTEAELVTSPNSLTGLTKLIRSARNSLLVQHLSLASTWHVNGEKTQSALIAEMIEAARRGVCVRVLLNNDRIWGTTGSPKRAGKEPPRTETGNEATVSLLNSFGEDQKLPIAARIVKLRNIGLTYVHNKGMTIDGNSTLISSINGTYNSIMRNREVAVAVGGRDANKYYSEAFRFDWVQSADLVRPIPNMMGDRQLMRGLVHQPMLDCPQ